MQKLIRITTISFLLLIISIIFSSLIGAKVLDFFKVFSNKPNIDKTIFFVIRLPRVILAVLTGGVLSLCGLIFQSLLKNPLADPFTLGISSGASFGAVLGIISGLNISFKFLFFEITTLPLFSFCGAILTVFLVYLIAKTINLRSNYVLILSGVILNLFFGSIITFLQFTLDYNQQYFVIKWLMGGLSKIGFENLFPAILIILTGLIILFFKTRELNLLSMGDVIAQTKGVDVAKVQRFFFIFTSILVGYIISFTGPIGFVGLIVPHSLRMVIGADHRLLLPTSFFIGGALLVICDTIARVIILPNQMPVGVITALIGAPFFIFLMKKAKSK